MPKMENINDDPRLSQNIRDRANKTGLFDGSGRRLSDIPKRFLSVRKMIDYGSVSIEFGVSSECQPVDTGDQMRLWAELEQQVSDMHADWAENVLPNISANTVSKPSIPAKHQKPESEAAKKARETVFEYEALEVYYDGDKKSYKVRTRGESTPYKLFGATVSDSYAKQLGLSDKIGFSSKFLPMGSMIKVQGGVVIFISEIP